MPELLEAADSMPYEQVAGGQLFDLTTSGTQIRGHLFIGYRIRYRER